MKHLCCLSIFTTTSPAPTLLPLPSPAVQVLINFGSSWCSHCHEMFPAFLRFTHQFPGLQYAVAQVDYLGDASVAGITYTPTFAVYKQGRKVGVYGRGVSLRQLWFVERELARE